MKAVFRVLLHPFLLGALATLTIAILIWWIGPLISIGSWLPLASVFSRTLCIAVIVGLVILRWLFKRWRARRASQFLTDGLVQTKPEKSNTPENAEQAVLNGRFKEAISSLKTMRLNAAGKKPGWRDWLSLSSGAFLYGLPWYVFIGAPGAGKTTALVNSGLSFPLAEKFGPGAIRGVGGTRNCDWWFTDEAVLIDTAGRYTTQDSNQAEDKTAWEDFLQLLKKSRPRRPLNGVFLAVSVADLLQKSQAERASLAQSIRGRLQEIDAKLAARLPVYVLVTKADLLHGFTEYFADLGKEQRGQVWGFTFPANESMQGDSMSGYLTREFDLLVKRLNQGLIDRLQQEVDPARRSAIFGFSTQFASLGPLLTDLLDQIFIGSKFVQPPWVRGAYFTSGTQEGSPIDRVMGSLSRSFGLARTTLQAQASSGRSYFLTSLLRDVVFKEQALAGTDLKWERKNHGFRLAGYAAIGLCSVGLVAGLSFSTYRNLTYLSEVESKIEPLRQQLAVAPATGTNLVATAPMLKTLRDSWIASGMTTEKTPVTMRFGLYQGDKLNSAAQLAHQRALNDVLLPNIAKRLEEQLRRAQKDNLEFSYEALKTYLMLYQPDHFDAEAFKAWITLDWSRSFDRGVTEAQRSDLENQLDDLIALGSVRSPLPMDESLVRNVRAMLASYPLEQRIFSRLKRQRMSRDVATFSLANAAGPSAPLVFERASGKPLTDGVSGWFTYDGYHKRFQGEVTNLTAVMAKEEPWVLGQDRNLKERMRDVAAVGALTDRVRRIYLENYIKEWDAFLSDIRLVRADSMEKNIQVARILSGADSPLANLLRKTIKEVTLIKSEADKDVVSKATESVRNTRKGLEDLFGVDTAKPVADGKRIESLVDDHFDSLRRLVLPASPNQPAPLDDALKLFNEVYVYLTAVDSAVKNRAAPPPAEAASKLKSEAGRLPEPVRSMIENLSNTGSSQARTAERGNLSQDLRPIAEFCSRAIAGRYPLVPSSPRDVLPEDFGQMFAPGGLMDDFFQKRLANLVDTSSKPWRYKPVGEQAGVSVAALGQFERAARIKDVFFRSGGRTPSMRLDFVPTELDDTITQFILDVDGQLVKYAHGPAVPMAVQWPGTKGSNQVRLQISPPSNSGSSGQTVDGPWALFRLLDKAQMERGSGPEKFFVTFGVDSRRAKFEVTANSVQHPIRLSELQSFSCPEGL